MRKKLVINDLHIGVTRVGGSSPQTALDLRLALVGQVRELMMAHLDKDIIINGDLFDAFDIPMGDALAFYQIACEWLVASGHDDSTLTIGRGNHDISKDSSRLSMFDFVGEILANQWERVRVVTEPTLLWPGFYMIPHAVNQDVFDLQLREAAKTLTEPHFIFLHANFDNKFAVEQDHSLNVSREMAELLTGKGHTLIFGHEHQAKRAVGVRITGNQFPTSVADCLGNDFKVATILTEPGVKAETVETWNAEGSFKRIDWRDIGALVETEVPAWEFIRVEGECSAEEAASMVSAVSKLRQKCSAFVVTNSVQVEGVAAMDDIKLAGEEMTGADVLQYLFEQLEEEQVAVVKKLLAERESE